MYELDVITVCSSNRLRIRNGFTRKTDKYPSTEQAVSKGKTQLVI